jgi:hypothetical protein
MKFGKTIDRKIASDLFPIKKRYPKDNIIKTFVIDCAELNNKL